MSNIKRLWGELEGNYRYRLGDLRIIYEVDVQNRIVKIKTIRSRGDIYKR
ncbi:MAG: type II toxin-antitoxin system RelE/ParE family toxin [bacterium]